MALKIALHLSQQRRQSNCKLLFLNNNFYVGAAFANLISVNRPIQGGQDPIYLKTKKQRAADTIYWANQHT